jgi:Flp pilus assembly protein TadG
VLIALLMTVLMGFAAMGFDLAYVRLARQEMMNATDAATHAAGITLSITGVQQSAIDKAKQIALANTVLGNPVKLDDSDIVFGTYDFAAKTFTAGGSPATAVQITGKKTTVGDGMVQLTFGRTLGMGEANVQQSATAAYQNRYFQIELQASDDWICEIDNAADAAVSLLDYLNGITGFPGDWIGLDEFTGRTQEISSLSNVRTNYSSILYKWQRNATVLGIQSGLWSPGGPNPPAPPQTKGITVCSKANATPSGFGSPSPLPSNPGGYRQCPNQNPPLVPLYSADKQFAFPNHAYLGLNCSDGGPGGGLYAGTNLAAAINDGVAKLKAKGQAYETHALILINDGTPMVCTGIGGGGLCGHTYSNDGVTPAPPKVSSDPWDPCCANGLTCGAADSAPNGYSFGGGGWGDRWPSMSPNGQAACDAAHQLVKDAIQAADDAAKAGIDVFVIGFFRDAKTGGVGTGVSPDFDKSLVRGRGSWAITNDSSQIGPILQNIPKHLPVTLVR